MVLWWQQHLNLSLAAPLFASYNFPWLQDLVEVHQRANDAKAQRPAGPFLSASCEAHPTNTASLLRDDKARKQWIEHELDMCCQVIFFRKLKASWLLVAQHVPRFFSRCFGFFFTPKRVFISTYGGLGTFTHELQNETYEFYHPRL